MTETYMPGLAVTFRYGAPNSVCAELAYGDTTLPLQFQS